MKKSEIGTTCLVSGFAGYTVLWPLEAALREANLREAWMWTGLIGKTACFALVVIGVIYMSKRRSDDEPPNQNKEGGTSSPGGDSPHHGARNDG